MTGKKSLHNRKHSKRRLAERYDLEVNKQELKTLARRIQLSGGKYAVRRYSRNRHLHKIIFKGKEILAVYDRNKGSVVTVLSPPKCQTK